MIAVAVITLRILGLWLHLLGVVVWLGTTLAWILVLLIVRSGDPPGGQEGWVEALGQRIFTVGWEAIFVIVLTGIFNLLPAVQSGQLAESDYYVPVLMKLSFLVGMIGLQAWQHGWLLSGLGDDAPPSHSSNRAYTFILVASGLVVALGAGALWIGLSLRY